MLLFEGVLGVVVFGVWVFCIIDVLVTRRDQVRNLPKLGWLAIVIVFNAIGAVAWLVFGRPLLREPALVGAARPARLRASSPDDDDEFLAALDARMREQRRRPEGDDDRPDAPPAG